MHKKFRFALCGTLCLAAAGLAAPIDALAATASVPNQASVKLPDPIDTVYYRRYYRRYPYRYGYYDPAGALFAGAALGMVAAGVAAASQPTYYYGYPGYYPYGWGW